MVMGKKFWIVCAAVVVSLYLFPKQDNFWAYLSVPYYLSICGLMVAIFLSIQSIHQTINYMILMQSAFQKTFVILFYVSILIILFLFFPVHSTIFFFLFAGYRLREWMEYKEILLNRKAQSNKDK
jgi:hypothetical protein